VKVNVPVSGGDPEIIPLELKLMFVGGLPRKSTTLQVCGKTPPEDVRTTIPPTSLTALGSGETLSMASGRDPRSFIG